MIFTSKQVAAIRQGKVRAALVLRSERVKPGRTRPLRRQVIVHDEDGEPIGVRREPVRERDHRTGEEWFVVLTILEVAAVDVDASDGPEALSLPAARACGYRTVSGLRDAWRSRHRSPLADLAWFTVGNALDRPLFLAPAAGYTQNASRAIDDAEVLPRPQLAQLAAAAGQRHARSMLDVQSRLASQSLARRIARIENARGSSLVRQELRIIAQRVEQAERASGNA